MLQYLLAALTAGPKPDIASVVLDFLFASASVGIET